MNCYQHQQRSAVAQCEVCSKGVCSDCDYEGACYFDAHAGIKAEVDSAKTENTVGLVLPIVAAVIGLLGAISSVSSNTSEAWVLLVAPVAAFVGTWCLVWGWRPFWGWVRGRGFAVGGFIGGGGGPIASAVRLAIVLLFIELVVIIIMMIGLFTGVQRFVQNKRMIALYKGGWERMFPGKYIPETFAQQSEVEPEAV
jgi:hypothetical protein